MRGRGRVDIKGRDKRKIWGRNVYWGYFKINDIKYEWL
jgi:hypothetical protein